MRIGFICSGLEPGQNGVGDYVCRLASEMIRHGHTVAAIALNDAGLNGILAEETKTDPGNLPILHLSRAMALSDRLVRASCWLTALQPDWVSLQFVSFGFDPKGLVSSWIPFLSELCGAHRMHWMFHELWVEREKGLPWHYGLWGWLQRRQMLKLHRRLSPLVTHTTNECYARMLKDRDINAEILPLFGNIPISRDREWWPEIERVTEILPANRADWLVLGIFGTIHWQWLLENWFTGLLQRAQANRRAVAMFGIGRLSLSSGKLWEKLTMQYAGEARFHHFGEQSPARISQYLSFLDYGVATGRASMTGKSGTIAAMLEHGKEVLVPCWDLPTDGRSPIAGVRTKSRFGMASLMIDSETAKLGLANVAGRLMTALETTRGGRILPLANQA
jgi:hypothetical protein